MTNLVRTLAPPRQQLAVREVPGISMDEWANFFTFQGVTYPFSFAGTTGEKQEKILDNFLGVVHGAYRQSGVVFACCIVRQLLFQQVRFAFRGLSGVRRGPLFTTAELAVLERPWPNGRTSDMSARAIQDSDLAGNFFLYRKLGTWRLKRLRPDWVTIVIGSMQEDAEITADDVDAELVGYLYQPGGPRSGKPSVVMVPEEVSHFAPIPDPLASYRGMSWISPLIREVMADSAAMTHKLKFFEHGGAPTMVVKFQNPMRNVDDFQREVETFRDMHEGAQNAYRTLFLGAGADVDVVGRDLRQLDFAVTQAHGEARVCAAAGVPAMIVGLKAGLEASTYNNFASARRRLADGTIRPLWENFCQSLESILPIAAGTELWYDDRDIAFIREDAKDAAEVQQMEASTINTLVTAGFTPESAVAAVIANDLTLLEHTGMTSVQLYPPGSGASANGNGQTPAQRDLVERLAAALSLA